ncbi:MAG: WcaI family glycosyltransferase [Bryobacteraceae bacterium]
MRAVVHHLFYKPEPTGTAPYTAELCERLAGSGYDVRVICPPPYFPDWRVAAPYRQYQYLREKINGVRVTRCPVWLPSRPVGWRRMLYMLSFLISSLPVVALRVLRPPDVVIAVEPTLLSAIPMLVLGKLTGALTWLHVQDFEIDIALETHQIQRPILRRLARWVDRTIRARFDVVSTISRRMCHRFGEKGIPASRVAYLPNWVHTETIFPKKTAENPIREELGISSDAIVALFSGTINEKQGLDCLVDAAGILRNETGIVFVVAGAGVRLDHVRQMARHLNNIKFLPLQPVERLNDLMNAADLHLLTQRAVFADLVMPSKLLAMLASGRPVVATAARGSELYRFVSQCGAVAPPSQPQAFAEAILALANDPGRRQELGARAREVAVRQFDSDRVLGAFEEELGRRLNPAGAAVAVADYDSADIND